MGIFFLTESKERRGTGNTNKYLNLLSTQVSSPQRHREYRDCTEEKFLFFCESEKKRYQPRNAAGKEFFWLLSSKRGLLFAAYRGWNLFFLLSQKKEIFPSVQSLYFSVSPW